MFGSRVGFSGTAGGSNGAIYDSNKSKMAATAMLEKFQVAISPQQVVRYTWYGQYKILFCLLSYSVSQTPLRFSDIFSQTVGNF